MAGAAAGFRALHPSQAPPAAAVAVFESPSPELGRRTGCAHHSHLRRPPDAGGRVVVYVAGEVARRGVYSLPASARAVDALAMAGGAAADADLVAVNLAAPLSDGEEIAVPPKGAVFSASSPERRASGPSRKRSAKLGPRRRRRGPSFAPDDGPAQLVDLNVADENELEALPGIGPALAARIVEFREANGPFASLDDLLDVGGMTQRKLDALEPYASLR